MVFNVFFYNYLDYQLTEEQLGSHALAEMETLLQTNDYSLINFAPMPMPNESSISSNINKLIQDELRYDQNMNTRSI